MNMKASPFSPDSSDLTSKIDTLLQRKSSLQWLTGSAVAVGAAAIPSNLHAGTKQITQANSFANLQGTVLTNSINPDFTGDGDDDLTHLRVHTLVDTATTGSTYERIRRLVVDNIWYVGKSSTRGIYIATAQAKRTTFSTLATAEEFLVKVSPAQTDSGSTPRDLSGFVPVTFSDPQINDGKVTHGLLEVRVYNTNFDSNTIEFVRLVFDDASVNTPSDAVVGGMKPEFDRIPVLRKQLKAELRKLKKALRRAKARDNKAKIRKFSRQIRKIKRKLRRL